jgi:hypothetical protein
VRRQLGPVVHPYKPRGAAAPGRERVELRDDLIGADRACRVHDERLAGVLVDDVTSRIGRPSEV